MEYNRYIDLFMGGHYRHSLSDYMVDQIIQMPQDKRLSESEMHGTRDLLKI